MEQKAGTALDRESDNPLHLYTYKMFPYGSPVPLNTVKNVKDLGVHWINVFPQFFFA